VNDEDCPIIVQEEHNLKQPIRAPRAPSEVLVIRSPERVGRASPGDHMFRLFGLNAVPRQMLDIPVIPAKVHFGFASEFTESSLIYIKFWRNRLRERVGLKMSPHPNPLPPGEGEERIFSRVYVRSDIEKTGGGRGAALQYPPGAGSKFARNYVAASFKTHGLNKEVEMSKAKSPVPEGFHTVTTQLTLDDAAPAIEWYKKALGAEEVSRAVGPDGKIMHAELRIGDSIIMVNDAMGGGKGPKAIGGSPASLWVYVKDCDALFKRAVAAGAKVLEGPMGAMQDQFWGDRSGTFNDPYGYRWSIATRKEDLTPQEMETRQKEWMKQFAPQPVQS
jgi:PhnB protein